MRRWSSGPIDPEQAVSGDPLGRFGHGDGFGLVGASLTLIDALVRRRVPETPAFSRRVGARTLLV